MLEQDLFLQMDLIRERTLQQIESVTEETADIIPPGHRNTLRWNLGHILTVHENLCFKQIGAPFSLPETYPALFGNGTKPSDWQIAPPSLETLTLELKQQPLRIKQALSGRLDERLPQPFKGIETLRGVIGFSLYHEGVHTGIIMSLRKAIG
ncbi:MAG: DinB family protein [Paenibacillus sp.]|jgi:hypothetical protein|nr:DinB family protein [Paenibacillus sp.]